MSIVVDWGNVEDSLLIWRFDRGWGVRDLQNACTVAHELLSQVDYGVDFIFDFGYTLNAPNNIFPLIHMLLSACPCNVRKVVVLSRTRFWERIFSLVIRMKKFRYQIYFVRTVDDAYKLVEASI